MNRTFVPDDLKPYLRYSAALHAGLALLLILALMRAKAPMNGVYTIEVVGPAPSIQENHGAKTAKMPAPAVSKAPAGHMEEHKSRPEFSRRSRHEALPPPSLLQGYRNVSAPKPEEEPAASAPQSAAAAGSSAAG
ncbi:MAG: hypothetical protein KGL04_11135, partial [Elusimicrobia bacterium]|nr:hypothetical protein [Elusimicrobiota bacterium]